MSDIALGGLLDRLDADEWAVEIQRDSHGYHVRLSMDDETAFRCVARFRLKAVDSALRWAREHGAKWLDEHEAAVCACGDPDCDGYGQLRNCPKSRVSGRGET